MNGLCLHAGGLGHALRRPSRRCRQNNTAAGGTIGGDDPHGCGGLARTRAAGEHHDLGRYRCADRFQLDFVVGDVLSLPCPAHDRLHHRIHIHLHTALGRQQFKQPLRTASLGKEKRRQVDGLLLPDHLLRAQHFVQSNLQLRLLHLQKLHRSLNQLLPYRIAVAILGKFIQCIENTAPQTDKAVLLNAHLLRYGIRRLETDAPDIVGQPVRILLHDADTVAAIGLKDLRGMAGADFMPLQKKHDILDLLLLFPALPDPLHPHSADAFHLDQRIRIFLDHIQRVLSEFLHNAAGKLRPHAFDQTGTKIFLDAVNRGRKGLFEFLHGKLAAVFGVHLPDAFQRKHRAYVSVRHNADYRHQILGVLDSAFEYCVAVVGILICNSFYDTA